MKEQKNSVVLLSSTIDLLATSSSPLSFNAAASSVHWTSSDPWVDWLPLNDIQAYWSGCIIRYQNNIQIQVDWIELTLTFYIEGWWRRATSCLFLTRRHRSDRFLQTQTCWTWTAALKLIDCCYDLGTIAVMFDGRAHQVNSCDDNCKCRVQASPGRLSHAAEGWFYNISLGNCNNARLVLEQLLHLMIHSLATIWQQVPVASPDIRCRSHAYAWV